MTAEDVLIWSAMILGAVGLSSLAAIAYLALMRWLIFIVPAIVLVGFAFEPALQMKFTATLLGMLALLYLPIFVVAWAIRRIINLRPIVAAPANPSSHLEFAHRAFVDEQARDIAARQGKAADDARDQEERDRRSRDLERQGIVSLWSRQ